jgi:hypothetical protein
LKVLHLANPSRRPRASASRRFPLLALQHAIQQHLREPAHKMTNYRRSKAQAHSLCLAITGTTCLLLSNASSGAYTLTPRKHRQQQRLHHPAAGGAAAASSPSPPPPPAATAAAAAGACAAN